MENNYKIKDDEVYVFIKSPDGLVEFIIDLDRLNKLKELKVNRWVASETRQPGKYYVKGHLSKIGSKYLHRLLFDVPEGMVVDHIDGNPLNNKENNIRIVTTSENNRNIRRRRGRDKDLPIGVTKRERCYYVYESSVTIEGEKYFLGYHNTIEDATKARQDFLRKIDEKGTII